MTLRESDILKIHTVQSGESLERISFENLSDPSFWKEIATVNNIDIFSEIPIGSTLQIPTLDVVNQEIERVLPLSDVSSDSLDLSNIISNIEGAQLISWIL